MLFYKRRSRLWLREGSGKAAGSRRTLCGLIEERVERREGEQNGSESALVRCESVMPCFEQSDDRDDECKGTERLRKPCIL